jgi:hypothetical protein
MQNDKINPKETAYDALVFPLMAQIIAICKEHNINHFATFSLDDLDDGEGPMMCTTATPENDKADDMGADIVLDLTRTLRIRRQSFVMTFTQDAKS